MNTDLFNNHKNNIIVIAVLALLFIAVIYLPKSIWDYEDELRDESRFRMKTVGSAEKLHYQLAKTYTTDSEQLLLVVNSVRDSLMAAANDSNYSFYGPQRIALPGKSVAVNYTDEYQKYYDELHLNLFKQLNPNHHMDPQLVSYFLDSLKTRFDKGNYVGEQSLELDSISLSFTVSEKYDILYQNIKTSMFNALTRSYTKYTNFSNPLVDAVMDSLSKNPALDGNIEFENIYDGSVRVDFIIPFNFEENLEKTKLALKKQFVIDSYDSATYGDTLYNMAVSQFFAMNDTSDIMPQFLTLMIEDTGLGMVEVPVEINTDEMESALSKRRDKLYTMLTGYPEPSPYIADHIISIAMDSLSSPGAGVDSFYSDIDLTGQVFTINVHNNIADYFHTVSLEQAYYKSAVNLSDLDWNKSAVEVIEYVAAQLRNKSDYLKWQVVQAETDTFYVDIFDDFLRRYDNMNLKLYEKLTGEFTNVFDYAFEVIAIAEHLAGVDTLDWSGSQVIDLPIDTLLVNVFPLYLAEYDTTFTVPRDTVVRINDSTFTGVWYRNKLGVSQDYTLEELGFLVAEDNSAFRYTFSGTDSVETYNILEKSDTAKVELVYYGGDTFVMVFTEDSLMENLYKVADQFALMDSIQVDSLNVVSEAFVVGTQEKFLFMEKDSFGGWQDTLINKKYEKTQLYSHYLLQPKHMRCTVTDIPFRITVRNGVNLTVESPMTVPIETNRYLFFTQVDSSHGRIVDGESSWAK